MQAALRAHHLDDKLYYTSPAGYVGLYITLGLYLGVVLAMPWVLLQIWQFVAPGLYKHERNAVAGFIISSMFLFLCGIAFGYFIVLPHDAELPDRLCAPTGPVKPLISINEYFDLILVVLVGLGIIFELPVVIFILSLFGIVTPKFLIKNFRYAMLIITILAAFATPTPDATTMLIFMAAAGAACIWWESSCRILWCGRNARGRWPAGRPNSVIHLKKAAWLGAAALAAFLVISCSHELGPSKAAENSSAASKSGQGAPAEGSKPSLVARICGCAASACVRNGRLRWRESLRSRRTTRRHRPSPAGFGRDPSRAGIHSHAAEKLRLPGGRRRLPRANAHRRSGDEKHHRESAGRRAWNHPSAHSLRYAQFGERFCRCGRQRFVHGT